MEHKRYVSVTIGNEQSGDHRTLIVDTRDGTGHEGSSLHSGVGTMGALRELEAEHDADHRRWCGAPNPGQEPYLRVDGMPDLDTLRDHLQTL